MAGKTRSSSMAEDTAVSFTKHMDNYMKNSEVYLQKPSSLQFKQQFFPYKKRFHVLKTNLLN